MNVVLGLLVTSFHAVIATSLSYRNHTCSPLSYAKICILGHLHYNPAEKNVIHNFPPNQSHVRITSGSQWAGHSTEVLHLDAKLYALLGQPPVLEVMEHAVQKLELPRALRHGAFPDSYTWNLNVESGADPPEIVYLDLTDNYLRNITNIESLVNLEVLLLSFNMIQSIVPSTFKNLTKLRYLCLSHNELSRISLNIFPQSITHLDLYNCDITSLNYGELYYPSLEMFNIEANELTSIDGKALMRAMPKLKMARIGWNNFEQDDDDLRQTIQLFRQHNISLRGEADEAACWDGDIEGVCLEYSEPPREVFSNVVDSLVLFAIVAASVGLLRWVFIAMNRK